MKRMPKVGELVMVEWLDAHSDSSWSYDATALRPARCESLGWIRHVGRRHIVIAGSRSSSGAFAERSAIPRSWLVRWRRIRLAKP